MSMDLYFVCPETKTAAHVGDDAAGLPHMWQDHLAAMNAFLAYNKGKQFTWMWNHEFEELEEEFTFFENKDWT